MAADRRTAAVIAIAAIAITALAGCGHSSSREPTATGVASKRTADVSGVAARPPRRGASLLDTYPELSSAIHREDPVATARALAPLGFKAQWVLIRRNPDYRQRDLSPGDPLRPEDQPTLSEQLPGPRRHTRILSVLNERGGLDAIRGSRELMIEITPKGESGFQE